jgi:transcriptional regulator with XRE-family HTH domain
MKEELKPRGLSGNEVSQRSGQAPRLEESFGSYLRTIRRLRGLRVEQMAAEAGVSEGKWDCWECNAQTPTPEELGELVRRLQFSPYKHERMEYLLENAARRALLDLSRSRLSALAAAGRAVVDAHLEWDMLGAPARDKLEAWARDKSLELPRDLLDFIATLKSDEEVDVWLEDVLSYDAL